MITRTLRVALALLATLGLWREASALSVNTMSRQAVKAFYDTVYVPTQGVPSGWNGSVSGCIPGSLSSAHLAATLRRVNYFRAMAGITSEVVLDATRTSKCQQAALIMAANRQLSHSPPSTWLCWTAGGDEAAGSSNLASQSADLPAAVDLWIRDPGVESAGHRRFILYPILRNTGLGAASQTGYKAYAMWVHGGGGTRTGSPEWVAWPPAGFVPYAFVSDLWSFAMPGASFSSAQVSVRTPSGSLPCQIQPLEPGYGDPCLVWRVTGLPTGAPSPEVPYTVTVSNVVVSGVTRSFTFQTIPMNPASTTAVLPDALPENVRETFELAARPNPFRASTRIGFELQRASEVRLEVFDLMGRRRSRLIDGIRAAGSHAVDWDGRDDAGQALPAGMYAIQLVVDGARQSRRVARLR